MNSTADFEDHSRYITAALLGSGWAAVQMWWAPELGGFWEPWDTGYDRYATAEEAEGEAREWAKAIGCRFIPHTKED